MRLLKSKSLTFDVYGAFVRDLGGWIAVADLVTLMGQLGVEEQVVRSSVSRFTRRGLLARTKVDGQISARDGVRCVPQLIDRLRH